MASLTDRYIWAAVRSVPEKQREGLDPEMRELIADSIDAQLAEGTPERDAEGAALIALGAPELVAARYTDRTLQLIGPRFYLEWLRLLKLLLAIVLPISAVGAGIGRLAAGGDIGDILSAAIVTGISVGVHLCFWVTLVFALIERRGLPGTKPLLEWGLDSLPQLPTSSEPRHALWELIAALVFLPLFIGWIVWQQFSSFFTDAAGDPVPLLNPELWSGWLPYFIATIVLEMGFALWLYLRGRWSIDLALVNVGLNALFTIPAVWLLLGGQLLNPAFLEAVGSYPDSGAAVVEWAVPVLAIAFVGVALWDCADGFVKVWQARRAASAGIREAAAR